MRKSLVTARWGLGAVFAAGFIMFGVASTVSGPLLPSIRLEYQLNLSQAGSLFSAQFIGFVLSVLVGGVVADTCGKRIFVLAGTGILTCGLVLVGCFYNRWLLTIGFFMTGIGFGGFDAGLSPLVGDLNPERRGLALNLLHMFFGVGALLGPLWAGHFAASSGTWRYAYLAMAVCSVIFLLVFVGCFTPKHSGEGEAGPRRFTSLLVDKRLMLLAGLMCTYVGLESGVSGWTFSLMTEALKTTSRVATSTVSLFWTSLTLGRLLSAYASERLGHGLFILYCCAGSVLASVPGAIGLGVRATMISCVALGFFFSGIFPTVMAQGTSSFPNSTGSVAGMLVAAGAAGGAVVPWLIGLVSDAYGLSRGMVVIPLGCSLMLALSLISSRPSSSEPCRIAGPHQESYRSGDQATSLHELYHMCPRWLWCS